LTDKCEGKPYLSPNDVCLDLAGNIYFTDPSNETPEAPIGSVYRVDTPKKVTRLATGLKYPNGLAVTPDQKQLIVAETMTNRIISFDFRADGSLAAARTLYQFPNSSVDGIMFDENDRLWVARWLNATVDVITLDGRGDPCGWLAGDEPLFLGKECLRHGRRASLHPSPRRGVGGKAYTK